MTMTAFIDPGRQVRSPLKVGLIVAIVGLFVAVAARPVPAGVGEDALAHAGPPASAAAASLPAPAPPAQTAPSLVPEPTTLVLMAVGAVTVMVVGNRRRGRDPKR